MEIFSEDIRYFSTITNEKLFENNQNDIISILLSFKKYFGEEEYFNKLWEKIIEKVESKRKEKMRIVSPISSWLDKKNEPQIIYNQMKNRYKNYSNPGVYKINWSEELEDREMQELLLLFNEED